jgi:hypothetical protein
MREDKKGGLAVMIGMGGMGNKGGMDECCEEVMFKAPEGMDVSEMKKGDEKEILATHHASDWYSPRLFPGMG